MDYPTGFKILLPRWWKQLCRCECDCHEWFARPADRSHEGHPGVHTCPIDNIVDGIGKIRAVKTDDWKPGTEKIESYVKKCIPKSWQPILTWNEILKSIDWKIIFLFGWGLVLGLGIEASGLATLLGDLISANVGILSTEWGIFASSAMMAFLISCVASNTTSAVIVCPIAASLTIGVGFSLFRQLLQQDLVPQFQALFPPSLRSWQ